MIKRSQIGVWTGNDSNHRSADLFHTGSLACIPSSQMGSGPTKHYSCRKSSHWMECWWKRGGELYLFYFFIVLRLITVTLNVKLSAHTRADPCQICPKSSTMLVSFYSFVLLCLLLQLQVCCIRMASGFLVELSENSSAFSDTALVFVSSLAGWRARKPRWRLWLKLILAKERQWFFQKTCNCCNSWWKPCYMFPVMWGVMYITATVCLIQYFPFLIPYPYFSGLLGSMHVAAAFKRTSAALM